MQFNDEQRQAITSLKRFILVSAGAGSGKTRILTERFVYLCELRLKDENHEAGATVDEIVAITFTEKAAREMKDRIRQRLLQKEEEATDEKMRLFWKEQKEAVEYAHISTFHSFCQKLLNEYAIKANLTPHMRVIDEMEATKKKRSIFKQLWSERSFIETAYPLLDFLSIDSIQQLIIEIHDYIREHVVGEDAIFSLRAEEMLKKQQSFLQENFRKKLQSFHQHASFCVEQFPPLDSLTGKTKEHIIHITEAMESIDVDEPEEYMATLLNVMPNRRGSNWQEKVPSLYELYENHWKKLKEEWKNAENISSDGRTTDYVETFVTLLQQFAERYKNEKEQAGELDFSDLQQKAVTLLDDPAVQAHCRNEFRHMMVDEFQDTNVLQLTVLNKINPSYRFIVGDQKQSIYRFRGANVSIMNEQEELAKRSDSADFILMNTNYRTKEPIIEAVNELFSQVMVSERAESYETVYAPLVAHRTAENETCVELTVLNNEEESEKTSHDVLASRIIEFVQSDETLIEKDGTRMKATWSDIAVLIPSRTNLLELERAFQQAEIPYVVHGGIHFFERQEVVDFLTILRWLNRPFEDIHLLSLLRSPLCGLTVAELYTLTNQLLEQQSLYELVYSKDHPNFDALPSSIKEACEKIQHWLYLWTPFQMNVSLEETLYDIFDETGLRHSLLLQRNGLQKVKNVEKLIHMIVSLNESSLEAMIEELDVLTLIGEKEGEADVESVEGDVVHIMTVHASKGLEFPIVCLPYLERSGQYDRGSVRFHPDFGIVLSLENKEKEEKFVTPCYPYVKEQANAEAREELKRLFYVAMTRARDYIYMIGEEKGRASNSWLAMLNEAIEETSLERYVKRREDVEEQKVKERVVPTYTAPKMIEEQERIPSFSVSEVLQYMHDPEAYVKKYIIQHPLVEEIEDTRESMKSSTFHIDPTRLGSLVHRACELRDYGLTTEAAIFEALVEEEEQLDLSIYEREMKRLMAHYTEEERKRLGDVIANEWSFATLMEGAEIIGEIDKIVQKDGKITIIDFKTNWIQSSGKELIDLYRPQLSLYKLAYEEVTGQPVDSVALYVLRDKKEPLHFIEVDATYEKKLRQIIQSMVQLKNNVAQRNVPFFQKSSIL